ncbi:zf-CCHC domain-containing protein [Tanacetum coccineum]
MSSEYEQYLKTDFVSGLQPKDFASYDVLGFWKSKENQFPVLSRMAMDILSVQASSVASESAFSTSGRLLTIRRTRLTPESLEMCMCLKDHLDAQERKQNTSPLELPLDVEEGVFNDEVQQNEATQLTDQEIALDASSDGSLSSGERRRDYMMSSGAEDDQTGEGGSMSHGYTYYCAEVYVVTRMALLLLRTCVLAPSGYLGYRPKSKTQADYGSGVARPKIEDNDDFELKGQFLKELRTNTFSGSDHEDAYEHIEKVLEIVDLFYIPNITIDQVMLRAFLMSLAGAASRWLRNEPTGIPTRQILDSRGAIPSKTAADAKVAIQEMAKYSQKWHNGTSRSRNANNAKEPITPKIAHLKKKGKPSRKLTIRNGRPFQRGGYKVAALGFYQRNNANPFYQERRQSMEDPLRASIKTLEIQIRQMSKVLQERGFESLPSPTEANPRDQVKSISTTIEVDLYPIRRIGSSQYVVSTGQNNTIMYETRQMTIMFPSRLNGYYCEEKKGSYGPQFSKAHSEASHINNSIPQKEKDQGVSLYFALLIMFALIMPLTVKYPKGIAENVLVGDDLMPTIEEGKVIEEFRTRDDELDTGIDDYPNKMVYKGNNVVRALMNVPIFVGTFSIVTDFAVLENMDTYRDERMGDNPAWQVLYKVEDIATCLVKYVKYGMIGKFLNEDILKITILKTNTPYPSRKIQISVPALTKDHKGKKINTPYPEEVNTPY